MSMLTLLLSLALQSSGTLDVKESGEAPDRKITVTSAGVYRAVVWQASGGGIMEFFDLGADPEAKVNLAGWDRGLFEIGWHGQNFKGNGSSECCRKHLIDGKKEKEEICYDGCRDWPSIGHKALKAQGRLDVIESSPARVRIQVESVFTWWSKYADPDMPLTVVYTFYPSGRIAIQVRVRYQGKQPFLWSKEYGPHLFVAAPKDKPELNPLYTFSTPTAKDFGDGFGPAEELVLAASPKVKTTLFITIPTEAQSIFSIRMHHDGRSVRWDRAGYGSPGIRMENGYDSTWACMIQMGTAGNAIAPAIATPGEALPHALDYRTPPIVRGAELVKDDAGDFNRDGFNESEGCTVLKSSGPLRLTYERGQGAGFAPAFKVRGWKAEAPKSVEIDGKEVPVVSSVVGETLILQIAGRIAGERASIRIGK